MCAVQFLGSFIFAVIRGEPFSLAPISPWPVLNATFLVLFWICGFGYLAGELTWQKRERDYQKHDNVA